LIIMDLICYKKIILFKLKRRILVLSATWLLIICGWRATLPIF
jgi:hypothetical protein